MAPSRCSIRTEPGAPADTDKNNAWRVDRTMVGTALRIAWFQVFARLRFLEHTNNEIEAAKLSDQTAIGEEVLPLLAPSGPGVSAALHRDRIGAKDQTLAELERAGGSACSFSTLPGPDRPCKSCRHGPSDVVRHDRSGDAPGNRDNIPPSAIGTAADCYSRALRPRGRIVSMTTSIRTSLPAVPPKFRSMTEYLAVERLDPTPLCTQCAAREGFGHPGSHTHGYYGVTSEPLIRCRWRGGITTSRVRLLGAPRITYS
ncbi:hypothetical protein B0H67DRAFT_305830 [Lasiosphaeris hirsuta]|uniref:Uncharacterized protein n=1 Tax=Lasiosphaeris hirsuta TaxID=260670 RepID=A0AA40DQ79_9PEZI|nr:hypothetical protein B0H67DRAFT_305830 [Lasiosphaeris hirsuta]